VRHIQGTQAKNFWLECPFVLGYNSLLTDNTMHRLLIEQAHLVIHCGDAYRVNHCEPEYFLATHEATGDEVYIYYSEINLYRDRVYGLQLLNPY
jgi:hypothetical protein